MCRATWKVEPLLLKNLVIDHALDAEAVQIYLDWLYSSNLRISDNIPRASDEFNLKLLKCWAVACALEDITFRNVIVTAFFVEGEACFYKESIKWAFTEGHVDEDIKEFVIEVFMSFMQPGWFSRESASWPDVFVKAVADRAFEDMRGKRDFEEIKRQWLKDIEEEEMGVTRPKAVKEKKTEVENAGNESDDTFAWLELPDVKGKKSAQSSRPRANVVSALSSRTRANVDISHSSRPRVHVERRTERGQAKTKDSASPLAMRVLRGI